jgi:hypothetical protein
LVRCACIKTGVTDIHTDVWISVQGLTADRNRFCEPTSPDILVLLSRAGTERSPHQELEQCPFADL